MLLIIFATITVALFLFTQWLDNRTEHTQPVWLIYSLPLLSYILTFGLRDGWFNDYFVYENVFLYPNFDAGYEFLFVIITKLMRLLGFGFAGALTVYVAFFVLGTFYLFSKERHIVGIAMAVFLLLNICVLGQLVRWSMGMGMLYITLRLFIDRKYYWAAFCAILTVGIHAPLGFVMMLMLMLYYGRPFRNVWINCALFCLSMLLTQQVLASFIVYIVEHVNFIPSSLRVAQYIEEPKLMDYFFQGDNLGISETMTFMGRMRYVIYYLWFIAWGYWFTQREKSHFWSLLYNMYILAAILYFPTMGFELMQRFNYALEGVCALVFACVIYKQYKSQYYLCMAASIAMLIVNAYFMLVTVLPRYEIRYIEF